MEIFYQGLNPASQTAANATAAGGLLDKTYKEAKNILDCISKNHEDWRESEQRLRIKDNDANNRAIASLQNQMTAMMSLIQGITINSTGAKKGQVNAIAQMTASCVICGDAHPMEECQEICSQYAL